jgi:hypothetical protein
VAKEKFIPYDNQKHGKYIVELRHGFSIFEEIKKPQIACMGERHMDGANFCIGISHIDKPFQMVDEAHKHDFDQYIFLLGADTTKLQDFDAEIEFGLAGKINKINYPACIHVIPGTMHGPLTITRVTKPFVFIDIVINPTPSVRPVPAGEKARKQ